jgi:hypothetical protein
MVPDTHSGAEILDLASEITLDGYALSTLPNNVPMPRYGTNR